MAHDIRGTRHQVEQQIAVESLFVDEVEEAAGERRGDLGQPQHAAHEGERQMA